MSILEPLECVRGVLCNRIHIESSHILGVLMPFLESQKQQDLMLTSHNSDWMKEGEKSSQITDSYQYKGHEINVTKTTTAAKYNIYRMTCLVEDMKNYKKVSRLVVDSYDYELAKMKIEAKIDAFLEEL